MGFGALFDELEELDKLGEGHRGSNKSSAAPADGSEAPETCDDPGFGTLGDGLLDGLQQFIFSDQRRGGRRRQTAPEPDPADLLPETLPEVVAAEEALDNLHGAIEIGLADPAVILERAAHIRSMAEALEAAAVHQLTAKNADVNAGFRTPTTAVKTITKRRHGEAARLVGVASKVRHLPLTHAAWSRGALTTAHVARLVQASGGHRHRAFLDWEVMLVEAGLRLSFLKFCNVVAHFELLTEQDPDEADDRERAKRSAEMRPSRRERGGGNLEATFDSVGYTIFHKVFREIERELFQSDWADAVDRLGEANVGLDDLPRTATQRRADALVEMAQRAAAMPAGARKPRPSIVVHISHAAFEAELKRYLGAEFTRPTYHSAQLANGSPVSPATALGLAIEGEIRRLVFDGPDIQTQFGRSKRFATPQLRAMIEARDRHCNGPGCEVPAWECDADHIFDWQYGGVTNGDDLEAKCSWHNRVKDNYRITTDPVTGAAAWQRKPPRRPKRPPP